MRGPFGTGSPILLSVTVEGDFELIGEIRGIETIATGHGIRILDRLNQEYSKGNWRKLKG